MGEPLYLSRLKLKQSPQIASLINRLRRSDGGGVAIKGDHHLLWNAMPDALQRTSPSAAGHRATFLWRRDDRCRHYYMLGPRPRSDSAFFDVESRPFKVRLVVGDRLQFVLRLNATVDRRSGGRAGTRQRRDVAMDLLHAEPEGQRAVHRDVLAETAVRAWLSARAEASGFALDALVVDGYRAVMLDPKRREAGKIGVFDLGGVLTVRDPETFVTRLVAGFGRAKAFGCGLMLIRRAG